MVALITVWNSDGMVGRCDAKCYNADHPHCDCICGSKNHGAGLSQAFANTTRQHAEMIAEFARQRDLTTFEAAVNHNPWKKRPLRPPKPSEPLPLFDFA